MLRFYPLLLLFLAGCHQSSTVGNNPGALRVESVDRPATKALFGDNPTFEVLLIGMDWSESPLVLPNGRVICSDVAENHVRIWPQGDFGEVYLPNSGGSDREARETGSNGLILNAAGQLVLCQHGARQVAVMTAPLDDPRPEYRPLATHYEGKRLNSPNDLIFAADGSLLFTDPPYGLDGQDDSPLKELDFSGVFRLGPDSTLQLLTRDLERPNGIALSPNERTLYVANSFKERAVVMAYPVLDDRFRLGTGEVLLDATELAGKEKEPGLPDGMVVAANGNLFVTAPGGVWVLRPDGTVLSKIRTGSPVSNLALTKKEDWLYLSSDSQLLRVRLI